MHTPPDATLQTTDPGEGRCSCGSLLARVGPDGVELKCRRCRRLVVIPWSARSHWHEISTTPLRGPRHRSQSPQSGATIAPSQRNSE